MKHLNTGHRLYGRGQVLSDEEVVRLYQETKDAALVGMRAGVCSTTVLNRVRQAGGQVYPRGHTRGQTRRQLNLSPEEIARLYRDVGKSGPELAEAAGCSVRQIYHILEAQGIARRRSSDGLVAHTKKARKAARGGTR